MGFKAFFASLARLVGSIGIRIGGAKGVTVSVAQAAGAPVKLDVAQGESAVIEGALGAPVTVQSGNTVITVSKDVPQS